MLYYYGIKFWYPEEICKNKNGGYVEGIGCLVRWKAYQWDFGGLEFREEMGNEQEKMMI